MRKHWVALLSMLGLAGSTVPVESQVLKGSDVAKESKIKSGKANTSSTKASPQWGGKNQAAGSSSKLQLNQQTLRQQNQAGNANSALTPPPPGQAGGKDAVTKANAQITKGNNNAALTKGANNSLTKAKNDAALTKAGANNQLTKAKNNTALTKANNTALTKAKTGPQ